MKKNNFYNSSKRRTPWDGKEDLSPTQAFIKSNYLDTYYNRHPILKTTNEAELLNSLEVRCCKYCGSTSFIKKGFTGNGIQRYKCKDCDKYFTIISNSLFENHKISILGWIEYLLNLFGYVSFRSNIYEEGSPEEIFNNPQKEKTRQFIQGSKVLEFDIQDKDFDFYGANTTIEEYCHKNHISYTKSYHLQSIFEELCVQILMPLLKDDYHIHFMIDYSEINELLNATILYGKEKINIEESNNEMSLNIINAFTDNIEYSNIDGEYVNKLILQIK